VGQPADLDDASLLAEFLSTSKAHADSAAHFANEYGLLDVPRDDERHPRNWRPERRQQLEQDRDALLALGDRFATLTHEFTRRRLR
jgi:hypothetical protein